MKNVTSKKMDSQLVKAMKDNMRLRGLATRTQESYLRGVITVTKYFDREPDKVSDGELKDFLIYMLDVREYAPATVRIIVNGIRDLFRHTLKRKCEVIEKFRIQQNSKLPVILTTEEMKHLLSQFTSYMNYTFFQLLYTTGLRKSEALNLQPQDIEGKGQLQRRIKVRNGKGGKDRYIPLPETTYQLLRSYWSLHRNNKYIFPAPGRSHNEMPYAKTHVSADTMRQSLCRAKKSAGIIKDGICIHTFRHSYATHLLEAGVDIRRVQKFLGHKNLQSTMIYLHLTSIGDEEAYKKINSIMRNFYRQPVSKQGGRS